MTSIQKQNYEVIVNGEKIFLNSTNPELAANAGKLLVTHLTNQSSLPLSSSPSSMKYSRTDLLTLATSPLSREIPENWDRLVSNLPSVIQGSPGTSRMVGNTSLFRYHFISYFSRLQVETLTQTSQEPGRIFPPCQEVFQ